MKKITLAYAACQESTSTSTSIACSCKKGCKTARCQCKKEKQKCSIACHDEEVNCEILTSLINWTEKELIQYQNQCRIANTTGLSVHWHNEERESEPGDDSNEDHIAELELKRMVASQGRSVPLWMKEKDLVGIT